MTTTPGPISPDPHRPGPPPPRWQTPPAAGPPQGAAGPPQGPGGVINFTVQGSVLTNNMIAPQVTMNGHAITVPTGGTAPITAPPGRHQIEVVSQWLRAYGRASLTVDLAPGQQVDVFYAAPYHQFSKGAIGLEPQRRHGLGVLIGIIAGVILLVALIAVVSALLG